MIARRVPLLTMLLIVAAFGFLFAALHSASSLWRYLTRDLVFFALTTAIGGAIFDRGPRRAFWVGLAIFGWQCFPPLSAMLGPGEALRDILAQSIVERLHPLAERPKRPASNGVDVIRFDVARRLYLLDPGSRALRSREILNDLLALAYGILGGFVTRAIAVRSRAVGVPSPDSSREPTIDAAT